MFNGNKYNSGMLVDWEWGRRMIKCCECGYIGNDKEFWRYENRNDDCEKVFRCPNCKELEPKFERVKEKEQC